MSDVLCRPITDYVNPTGALTINSVGLHTPAWHLYSPLTRLYTGRAKRGSNTRYPFVQGTGAEPKLLDEVRHELFVVVTGAVDVTGGPYANAWAGFQTNHNYLTAQLVDDPGDPVDGTLPASLVDAIGATHTTDLTVLTFDPTEEPTRPAAIFSLIIELTAGRFA